MFEIGNKVELKNQVKGVPVGTQAVVQGVRPDLIIVDLGINDTVLEVSEQDIELV